MFAPFAQKAAPLDCVRAKATKTISPQIESVVHVYLLPAAV
jgi:hypothetical protein